MYNSLKTIICIFIVTSILFSQRENEVFKYVDPLKVDMNEIHPVSYTHLRAHET